LLQRRGTKLWYQKWVDKLYRKYRDIGMVSIDALHISVFDNYRRLSLTGDRLNMGNFSIFHHTFSDFLALT